MTDEEALLDAILAAPKEDTPRLVYADWLEENTGTVGCRAGCKVPSPRNDGVYRVYESAGPESRWVKCPACSGSGRVSDGRRERAEFIRVQVELARNPPWCGSFTDYCVTEKGSLGICVKHALRHRERELLVDFRDENGWSGWSQFAPEFFRNIRGFDWDFSRGFVSALTCTWDAWREHAAAILKQQPIERVRLTTMPNWNEEGPPEFVGAEDDRPRRCGISRWPGIEFELPSEQERWFMSQVQDPTNYDYSSTESR